MLHYLTRNQRFKDRNNGIRTARSTNVCDKGLNSILRQNQTSAKATSTRRWTRSGKRITGWTKVQGGFSNDEVFNHMRATVPPESSQVQCYEVVCKPLVEKWLDGYDVDLLTYGQTGSGKTYTMFGPPLAWKRL